MSSVKNLVISLSICKSFPRGDPTVSSSNCKNRRNTDYPINELWHEISNNLVCATSKGSDQPAHTSSLIRAFAGRLIIL